MFILSHFKPKEDIKTVSDHLHQMDVPKFWKGFYSVYPPNSKYNKSNFWIKRWSQHKNKTTKEAHSVCAVL